MIKLFYIINNKGQVRLMKHYDQSIVNRSKIFKN
jgi:hypothetical protein